MLVSFTPYTYLFFSFYFLMLVLICSLTDFFAFWFVIELIALSLVGLSFTLFSNSLSQLIVYFFIQSVASFVLMVAWLAESSLLFSFALVLNLGMFPFHSWYVSVLTRFPTFIFFLTTTIHKLPPLLLVSFFSVSLLSSFIWLSLIFSVFTAGIIMLSTHDLRFLLASSSVGNNSWFFLSANCSLELLFSYLLVYCFITAALLSLIGQRYSLPICGSLLASIFLVALSGLPPFPVFFINMVIVGSLVVFFPFSHLVSLLLLFNSLMMSGYVIFTMSSFVNFSRSSVGI